MNEALDLLEEFKINGFSFLSDFCDWMVDTPVPFIFISLFLTMFACKVLKRMM